MPKALYVLSDDAYRRLYSLVHDDLARMVDILSPPLRHAEALQRPDLLAQTEVLITGWGAPTLDANTLSAMPNLKLVLYGAGSVRGTVTPAFWETGIPITSAASANAVPVAEFTLAQILLCLKGTWQQVRTLRRARTFTRSGEYPGAYGTTVGLISLGMIGRRVCELLEPFDVHLIAYDPFVSADEAGALGVTLVDLESVFRQSDVVSLHTPWLPETEGMINATHFRMMKPHSAFINTARGAVINEAAMISVLEERDDILAVLDVTYPEPPPANSPLFTLDNVVLTPHIAGSISVQECRRMGETMVSELRRFLNNEPLEHRVHEAQMATIA